MRGELQPGVRTGSDLERKYPVVLALFVVLGLLVWFTVGQGAVMVMGKPVEIRMVALLIIGLFAFRTMLARQADRIRRSGEEGADSTPKSL
jgi:hypothetical protein